MTDLAGLHAQATRLILSLRDGLERLEGSEVGARCCCCFAARWVRVWGKTGAGRA